MSPRAFTVHLHHRAFDTYAILITMISCHLRPERDLNYRYPARRARAGAPDSPRDYRVCASISGIRLAS